MTIRVNLIDDGELTEADYTFGDLVKLLRLYPYSSREPRTGDRHEWRYYHYTDPRTGQETQQSVHYNLNNPESMARYWRLALLWENRLTTAH